MRLGAWPLVLVLGAAGPAQAQEHDVAAHQPAPPPKLILRGFTNVDYAVHEESQPNSFALGQFDLFITSALSENWSFLSEVNFEFDDENQLAVDVERAQLRYAPSDRFSIAAGRMHTPLGYWNQTFHHGAWFQTTAQRPQMYLFEDDGGILPVHEVGLQAAGTIPSQALAFKYSVSLVNGRGRIPDDVTNIQDRNGSKAVNLYAAFDPAALTGFEVGGDAWLDKIPADPEIVGRESEIRERILGGYVAYVRPNVELLAELSHVHHRVELTDAVFDTWAFYAQASRAFGRLRPYYRFDKVDVAVGDPFLPPTDLSRHTVGVRFDPMPWVGLKGEYHLTREEDRDVSSGRFQAAFTF